MSSLPPPNKDDDDEQNLERPVPNEAEELVADTVPATTATNPQSFNDLPLDWTKLGIKADDAMPLRYPHDVADWSLDDLDICIVGTAGQKITQIPKDFYKYCHPQLETLIFRSHMISALRGLEGLKHLDTLELYDNQVQALDCLEGPGPNLRVLDVSYNSIRDMTPVSLCPNLQELCKSLPENVCNGHYVVYVCVCVVVCMWCLCHVFATHMGVFLDAIMPIIIIIIIVFSDLANNKLKSIAGLSSLVHLKKIDLGANRIRVLDERELGGLVNLEELWIGKNKIEEIRGLEKVR
jgi:protein phosphatase 1 regulatory subunit 7